MRFTLTAAFLALSLVLSQQASAAEWPTVEIRNSCPKLTKKISEKNGTVIYEYYGCGEKDSASVDIKKGGAGQQPELNRQLQGLAVMGLTEAEMLNALHSAWRERVLRENWNRTYQYEEADIIFRELYSSLEKYPFPEKSVWPHEDIDIYAKNVVQQISWAGRSFGKHYGELNLKLMSNLNGLHR